MKEEKQKKQGLPEGVRVYLSKAYLVEVEKKTYALYRDQVWEDKSGTKELMAKIGPIGLFRECEGEEKPELETFDSNSHRMMKLVRLT